METKPFTNAQLWEMDFASKERAAFLRSIPPSLPAQSGYLAPALPAAGIWMTDVSAMDRRSVNAQLAGRGVFRAAWWALHCLLYPHASLEQAMFAFHRRHHALTLFWLEVKDDYRQMQAAARRHGFMAGLRCALQQRLAKERP